MSQSFCKDYSYNRSFQFPPIPGSFRTHNYIFNFLIRDVFFLLLNIFNFSSRTLLIVKILHNLVSQICRQYFIQKENLCIFYYYLFIQTLLFTIYFYVPIFIWHFIFRHLNLFSQTFFLFSHIYFLIYFICCTFTDTKSL